MSQFRETLGGIAEALDASVSHIPLPLRRECLLVGGTALVLLGSTRQTEDLDFAVTEAAHFAFINSIKNDPRFSRNELTQSISYHCLQYGSIDVNIDFIRPGFGDIPNITHSFEIIPTVYAPTAEELLAMKAACINTRDGDADIVDFNFLVDYLTETKSNKSLEWPVEHQLLIQETVSVLDKPHQERLQALLTKNNQRQAASLHYDVKVRQGNVSITKGSYSREAEATEAMYSLLKDTRLDYLQRSKLCEVRATTGGNHGLLAFELQPQGEAILFVFVDKVASVDEEGN